MTATIPLRGEKAVGMVVLVDDADMSAVASIRWHISAQGYAVSHTGTLMHRLLMDAGPGMEVDHVNLDRLDNRRANLRLASKAENRRNSARRSHSGQPYKGVRRRPNGTWQARIRFQGQEHHLGQYATAEQAAVAYDEASRFYHRPFGRTNFEGITR